MRSRRRLSVTATTIALGLVLGATPAAAHGPPQIVEYVDLFHDINPCTGQEHTLTVSVVDRVHVFTNETTGRVHGNLRGFFNVTTDDGFAGTTIGPAAFNEGGHGAEMFVEIFAGIITNSDTGERFRFHQRVQFVVVDGDVVVDRVETVSTCLPPRGGSGSTS
jgi:hypothetical protein